MQKELRHRWKIHSSFLLMCFLLGSVCQAQTEAQQSSHYISPRLQLGLHTKASLDSPIKELLSSGTAVKVLKSDKDFTQIKAPSGTKGWIKSKFLTAEEPAALKVKQLELALQQAQQKLLKQVAQIRQMNTEAESDPQDTSQRANEETIAQLKAELQAWEQLDLQDKQLLKEQAGKINQQLKKRLAMIASLAIGNDTRAGLSDLATMNELPEVEIEVAGGYGSVPNLLKKIKKEYLVSLMIAGLGFVLGIFVMDLYNRRRHGGYRV